MPRIPTDRSFVRRRNRWRFCEACGWEGAAHIWFWNRHRTTRKYLDALYILSEDVACDCGGVAYRFREYGVPVASYWALLESFQYRAIQRPEDWEDEMEQRKAASSVRARLCRRMSPSRSASRAADPSRPGETQSQ